MPLWIVPMLYRMRCPMTSITAAPMRATAAFRLSQLAGVSETKIATRYGVPMGGVIMATTLRV